MGSTSPYLPPPLLPLLPLVNPFPFRFYELYPEEENLKINLGFSFSLQILRAAAGIEKLNMGILCADDGYMEQLNDKLHRKDHDMGLLTFPYNEVR